MPFRRTLAMTLVTATAALTLVACSSADDGEPAREPASNSAFPVSVAGALGTADVPDKPERVVALTWTDADIVFSLGVTPISVAQAQTDSGYQPWFENAVPQTPPVWEASGATIPIEEIAALQPDLIVATKSFTLARAYDQLKEIAPVVHFADTPSSETWQSATATVASALGVPETGEQVIADTESRIADAAAQFPELNGKTFTFFVGPSEGAVYIVNSPDDAGASLLGQLGMTPTEFATAQPVSTIPGRAQISYDYLSETDADVIIATGLPGSVDELAAQPAVQSLPAVGRGAFVPLSPTQAQSIAFPSPLSLDWALNEIVPQLGDAARK
ncbi:ABC transporter substrate-binding protein [Rhodococcoides fascians]|uniref:ABC transporter substrate-binding protein n=1 Tax=Rhodococcoides fascians TaxID=1828 RepID=UPI00055AB02C|nr:ABC transporter substrate-binding protein [Rhodococcus fascians]